MFPAQLSMNTSFFGGPPNLEVSLPALNLLYPVALQIPDEAFEFKKTASPKWSVIWIPRNIM